MKSSRPLSRALAVVGALALVLSGVATASAATPAAASSTGKGEYLALGDSVPFGFDPTLTVGGDAARYVGYPQLAARRLGLTLTDLACPGETSGSFLRATDTDNGCRSFRAGAPLHAAYSGTQADAARDFLRAHPRTTLVTLMIGANDLFLCEDDTADRCASTEEIEAVLATYRTNVEETLLGLRSVYRGRIVVVGYYSRDYREPVGSRAVQALDTVMARAAAAHGATYADGYRALAAVAAKAGGSTCDAGLLIKLPSGTCDIHPSPAGAAVLATTLVTAVTPNPAAAHRPAKKTTTKQTTQKTTH